MKGNLISNDTLILRAKKHKSINNTAVNGFVYPYNTGAEVNTIPLTYNILTIPTQVKY